MGSKLEEARLIRVINWAWTQCDSPGEAIANKSELVDADQKHGNEMKQWTRALMIQVL